MERKRREFNIEDVGYLPRSRTMIRRLGEEAKSEGENGRKRGESTMRGRRLGLGCDRGIERGLKVEGVDDEAGKRAEREEGGG